MSNRVDPFFGQPERKPDPQPGPPYPLPPITYPPVDTPQERLVLKAAQDTLRVDPHFRAALAASTLTLPVVAVVALLSPEGFEIARLLGCTTEEIYGQPQWVVKPCMVHKVVALDFMRDLLKRTKRDAYEEEDETDLLDFVEDEETGQRSRFNVLLFSAGGTSFGVI